MSATTVSLLSCSCQKQPASQRNYGPPAWPASSQHLPPAIWSWCTKILFCFPFLAEQHITETPGQPSTPACHPTEGFLNSCLPLSLFFLLKLVLFPLESRHKGPCFSGQAVPGWLWWKHHCWSAMQWSFLHVQTRIPGHQATRILLSPADDNTCSSAKPFSSCLPCYRSPITSFQACRKES